MFARSLQLCRSTSSSSSNRNARSVAGRSCTLAMSNLPRAWPWTNRRCRRCSSGHCYTRFVRFGHSSTWRAITADLSNTMVRSLCRSQSSSARTRFSGGPRRQRHSAPCNMPSRTHQCSSCYILTKPSSWSVMPPVSAWAPCFIKAVTRSRSSGSSSQPDMRCSRHMSVSSSDWCSLCATGVPISGAGHSSNGRSRRRWLVTARHGVVGLIDGSVGAI
jgi:hypothetical protein